MQMKRIVLTADNPFDEGMLERAGTFEPEVIANVSRIIDDVRKRGDEAVREYTKRFDGLDLDDYRVPEDEIDAAFDAVSEEVVESLELAAEHIRLFHEQQRRQSWFITRDDGAFLGTKVTPIERVGLYVPGGRARYPSTVLMDAIPAKVAGVDRIAMTTPPASDGRIDATTLVAARIAGVDEVYSIGGAQAIAALAYGTASIERVDKIVGPGNIFVAAAKKLVSGDVGIDMIAGPSEVCILASRYCTPEFVAIDLMAQAEHDPQAICYLISSTEELADRIEELIEGYLPDSPRADITRTSLETKGLIFVTDDLEEAVDVANAIAPEHLEVHVPEPMALIGELRNAGAIFLGDFTPTPVGDYVAGPNHTLPTSGTARFSSPLSVDDFVKRSSVVNYTYETLVSDAEAIRTIATQEGLWSHARSVELRLELIEEALAHMEEHGHDHGAGECC
jgi:histidinol dehydrogenase